MKTRSALLGAAIAVASALACSSARTNEAPGEVVPADSIDTTRAPLDTLPTGGRDDTLTVHRDTSLQRDTSLLPRDTAMLPRDTNTVRRDTISSFLR